MSELPGNISSRFTFVSKEERVIDLCFFEDKLAGDRNDVSCVRSRFTSKSRLARDWRWFPGKLKSIRVSEINDDFKLSVKRK